MDDLQRSADQPLILGDAARDAARGQDCESAPISKAL